MNNWLLICMVGLPRSGKSTWAREQGFPIVSKDAIRLALHGERYLQQAEGWVHTISKTMVHSLFMAGHDTVILDETNGNYERRRQWWSGVPWDVKFKVIDTKEEVCIERAEDDGDEVIIPVIKEKAAKFDRLFGIEKKMVYDPLKSSLAEYEDKRIKHSPAMQT